MTRIRFAKTFFRSPTRYSITLLFTTCLTIPLVLPGLAVGQTPSATASEIRLSNTSLCADVSGASLAQGTAVISWICISGANQQWLPTPTGAQYAFVNQTGNQCLDVSRASMRAVAPVIQSPSWGGPHQGCSLQPQRNGYALVVPRSD